MAAPDPTINAQIDAAWSAAHATWAGVIANCAVVAVALVGIFLPVLRERGQGRRLTAAHESDVRAVLNDAVTILQDIEQLFGNEIPSSDTIDTMLKRLEISQIMVSFFMEQEKNIVLLRSLIRVRNIVMNAAFALRQAKEEAARNPGRECGDWNADMHDFTYQAKQALPPEKKPYN